MISSNPVCAKHCFNNNNNNNNNNTRSTYNYEVKKKKLMAVHSVTKDIRKALTWLQGYHTGIRHGPI